MGRLEERQVRWGRLEGREEEEVRVDEGKERVG